MSSFIKELVKKNPLVYQHLTKEEKAIFHKHKGAVNKLIHEESDHKVRRGIFIDNPELTSVTTDFLNSLQFNDGQGGKATEENDQEKEAWNWE